MACGTIFHSTYKALYPPEKTHFTIMDTIITTLAAHGGIGMFCAAFLAGTFLPFASEAVLLALLEIGRAHV